MAKGGSCAHAPAHSTRNNSRYAVYMTAAIMKPHSYQKLYLRNLQQSVIVSGPPGDEGVSSDPFDRACTPVKHCALYA